MSTDARRSPWYLLANELQVKIIWGDDIIRVGGILLVGKLDLVEIGSKFMHPKCLHYKVEENVNRQTFSTGNFNFITWIFKEKLIHQFSLQLAIMLTRQPKCGCKYMRSAILPLQPKIRFSWMNDIQNEGFLHEYI